MIRKYWPFILLVILILIFLGLFKVLKDYQADQRARVAKLQEKAAEVQVTLIEGLTEEEVAAKLEQVDLFPKEDFLKDSKKFDYSSYPLLINKPVNTTLEGYLFPDTYRFHKGATTDEVLTKILDNFSKRLASIGVTSKQDFFTIPGYEDLTVVGGDGKSGMSLYDILVLASIVEQESGNSSNMSLAEERALIAGVFYNRLSIGQALESDATVNYVTGKNDPGATYKDIEVNSPYNTYKYAGLPPGPIGNPSLGSIQAALRPTKSDYFYFLHRQPSGEVQFSKTFSEHVQKRQ
jgi:UPF0755 protein